MEKNNVCNFTPKQHKILYSSLLTLIIISIIFIIINIGFLIYDISHHEKNCDNTSAFINYNNLSQDKRLETICNNSDNSNILDWPVNKFYFNASHNTYLNGAQVITNNNSPDCCINALKQGARYIELDVYPDAAPPETNQRSRIPTIRHPQVVHKNNINWTNSVKLEDHLKAIKSNAFKTTNDPLIIDLELYGYSDTSHMQKIKVLFQEIFGDLLYSETLKKLNYNTVWPIVPIRNILGKVIVLIPGTGGNNESNNNYYNYLSHIAHGISNQEWNIKKGEYNVINKGESNEYKNSSYDIKPNGIFSRIYPDNVIANSNYAPGDFWSYNHNAVALNFSPNSVNNVGNTLFKKYKYSNIVPIDANINSHNSISLKKSVTIGGRYYENFYENINPFDIEYLKPNTAYRNCSWISNNGKYIMAFNNDGYIVISNVGSNKWNWDSNYKSRKPGSVLHLQNDGNLVIYDTKGNSVWSTGAKGKNSFGYLNDSGELTIQYRGSDKWKKGKY